MRWLLRLLFIRLLGRRAVPILAALGFLGAIRRARSRDVEAVDPATGRVRMRGEKSWR